MNNHFYGHKLHFAAPLVRRHIMKFAIIKPMIYTPYPISPPNDNLQYKYSLIVLETVEREKSNKTYVNFKLQFQFQKEYKIV